MNIASEKAKKIEKIQAFSASRIARTERADVKRFIAAFYYTAAPEEFANASIKSLFFRAHSMWLLGTKRTAGKPLIKIFNPSIKQNGGEGLHTVIQIINDDMPFLVDSITGGLATTQKIGIHLLHHPIFQVQRKASGTRIKTIASSAKGKGRKRAGIRESYIHIEIDRQRSAGALKKIKDELDLILSDVRLAVDDWPKMISKANDTIAACDDCSPNLNKKLVKEAQRFIRWLIDDHFTFLGYREYRLDGNPKSTKLKAVRGSGLGVLRDPTHYVLRGPKGLTAVSEEIREFLRRPVPIIITKANVRTRVHRPVHMDYIGIKTFDKNGKVIGERRFVGLFTSQSYGRSAQEVPYLRLKIKKVQDRALYGAGSHEGKTITHIIETFPRDELFQIGENELWSVCMGVMQLMERPKAKAFIRSDKFERFVSALVYVPRDKYNSTLRVAIAKILCDAYQGEVSAYFAQLSEDALARWHFIIRTKPGAVPKADHDDINQKIQEAAKDWKENLEEALIERYGEEQGGTIFACYGNSFSVAYNEAFLPYQAVHDIELIGRVRNELDLQFSLYKLLKDPRDMLRLKIYGPQSLVPLSDCLPMLENLGLKVISEHAYELQGKARGCIHDFTLKSAYGTAVDVDAVQKNVEHLLSKVWRGEIENDNFNALTIKAGLPADKIIILRAYSRYLRQIGITFSQSYIEDCLVEHALIARQLVKLFETMFSPPFKNREKRERRAKSVVRAIRKSLNRVLVLDHDRILRGYLRAIKATVRTNFYQAAYLKSTGQTGEPAFSLKIHSRHIEDVPKPRPYAEIFVYSPRFEGVHLRNGPIARGGLRWSDRREDFRTEVMGLVKAQQVKNSIIVPVGAKGGFVPKRLSKLSHRDSILKEGEGCYRSFIVSLLSLTDNLVGGKVKAPLGVMCWDNPDPYFVVAADKGTATFSDIANEIAEKNDFWLGDAFASGGSNGYDHKKMGITARGAWVSVERHFREMGINLATDPITVIGIGDMSGDVFGNGMLLSKHIKLKAAFDHRHIFFDPDPDPATSFEERERLFYLPRSSWAEYEPKLISKGGGIYPRSLKTIVLNDAFQTFLSVDTTELTPAEVIHLILQARADLLWIGGIGTYVKAKAERNNEVGDRANDVLRINAGDLRVKVIGEGGNLGFTQQARIEFAASGGRINTDFVDNSAGVDCSDKEVNIKILLSDAVQSGRLEKKKRNRLLASMTKDVSRIVLEDNYLQTQAISIAQAQAITAREQQAGLLRLLEKDAGLDREIENLPSDEQISELAVAGVGLTRPELAVLTSYAKMSLNDVLQPSELLDDPILQAELEWGFPKALHDQFSDELSRHRLRREIIATTLANEVINRAGLTFVYDVKEETGLAVDEIAAAFLLVREAFTLGKLWPAIDALDYKVTADTQIRMHMDIAEFVKHQAIWFLHNSPRPLKICRLAEKYGKELSALMHSPDKILGPLAQKNYKAGWQALKEKGVPADVARSVASLSAMGASCDIVNVALKLERGVEEVGKAYYGLGHQIGFDWLGQEARRTAIEDHWDQLAAHAIIDDLADQQRELTRHVLTKGKGMSSNAAVSKWLKDNKVTLIRSEKLMSDLKSSGQVNIARLGFAARHIRSILPL